MAVSQHAVNQPHALPGIQPPNAFPDVLLLCVVDILGDRSILDVTTAMGRRHREYGIERVAREVHLRTPRQVTSFMHMILASPQKRGRLVDSLRICLPTFEGSEDAGRLNETLSHLVALRSLHLDEPEVGLAAHPRLIDGFRALRSVRLLRVTGADEWTGRLLRSLKSGLERVFIHRPTAAPRGFSMSFVLWRFASTLQELHVDKGFAAFLEDDDYNPGHDGLYLGNQVALFGDDPDMESGSDASDVDDTCDVDSDVDIPDFDDLSGGSSGYTSVTYTEDDRRVLSTQLIDKLLSIGGAIEDMEELAGLEESVVGDNDDAQSVVSDIRNVEWVYDKVAVFPSLGHLVVPDLLRTTRGNLMLATPALTFLDVGATCDVYTKGLRRLRMANQFETYHHFMRRTKNWAHRQVRGGLLDLALLGNTTIVSALEITGVVRKFHRLLPAVVDDHKPTILRVELALPFKVAMLSHPEYGTSMALVRSLALRVVVKKDVHLAAFENSLFRVLCAFKGLLHVFLDLTYDPDDHRTMGTLDGIDLDGLANKLMCAAAIELKYYKLFCLKRGFDTKCWERTGPKFELEELSIDAGRKKMHDLDMLSDAYSL